MANASPKLRKTDGRLHLGIVTGEVSGDAMAARLVAALAQRLGRDGFRLTGVGGEELAAQGLDSLFDHSELSLMGLTQVARQLPRLVRRRRQVLDAFTADPPDAIIGVDASAFVRSISLALHRRGHRAKRILYKAPQAWAYWPWRARRLRGLYDLVLAILPFEPAFFAGYGVAARFVGHPALDAGIEAVDVQPLAERLGLASDQTVLTVLPGSRGSEVAWSLPMFGAVAARAQARAPNLVVLVPTVGRVADRVQAAVADWPMPVHVLRGETDRFAALRLGTAALAASGTVSTELAIAGTPMVIGYRLEAMVGNAISRFVVRAPFATVCNLVLEREAVPERLQRACTADNLTDALLPLLADTVARRRQIDDLALAVDLLRGPDGSPSQAAASAILDVLGANGL